MIVAVAVVVIFVGIGVGMSNVSPEPVQTISDRPAIQQQAMDFKPMLKETIQIPKDTESKEEKSKSISKEFGNIKNILNNPPEILGSDSGILKQGKLSKLSPISLYNLPIVLSFNEDVDGAFEYTKSLRERISELESSDQFTNQIAIDDKFVEYEDKVILYKRTIVQITSADQYNYIFKPTPTDDSEYSNQLDATAFKRTVNDIFSDIENSDELISVIDDKNGFHSQTEYVEIPKSGIVSCNDTSPEDKFCIDLDSQRMIDLSFDKVPPKNIPPPAIMPDIDDCELENGTYHCDVSFVNGFTYGISWHKGLETQWIAPTWVTWLTDISEVWYINAYVDIQNGFGLRLPLLADITVRDFEQNENFQIIGFSSTYALSGMNFDAEDFAEAGISRLQLFNGNEFVLVSANNAHLEVRLIDGQVSIGPHHLQLGDFDQSRDFTTPLGSDTVQIISIEIPGSDLGLVYSILFLTGQVDLKIDVDGGSEHVDAQITGINSSHNVDDNHQFNSPNRPSDFLIAFDEFSVDPQSRSFGFELSNLEYYPLFEVTPNARLAITMGIPGALTMVGLDGGAIEERAVELFGNSYTYRTAYYPLFTLSIEPGFSFGAHDGTSGTFVFSYAKPDIDFGEFDVEEYPGLNP